MLKTHELPERFKNENELRAEMMFLKYNQTTEISWYNLKGIIRPEMVALLFYHWSCRQFDETHVMSVPKRFAYVRYDEDSLGGPVPAAGCLHACLFYIVHFSLN